MKNLFKKLMLVAVAAMAFTACSQDNNELNNLVKKTVFSFQANIGEDTRSGFMEKEEGATSYKSEWYEGDQVKIFIDGHEPIVADIDTDGNFSFELEGEVSEIFFMSVCAPADSWEDLNTCNIPYYQEPLANTVDPRAHLLSAKYVPVTNGSADITMIHNDAAYAKMTLDLPEDFNVESVEVMFEGVWIGENITRRYEVSAENVVNNTFWFACDPMTVSKFSVVASEPYDYDLEYDYNYERKSMSKTVDVAAAGKELEFAFGRVATFSVSGLTMPLNTIYAETTVNENAITFEWEEVENAVSYTVYLKEELGWNQDLYMTEYGPESSYPTTELTYTISDLKYNTRYAYAVVANPAADSKIYAASEKIFRDVKTGIDPNNFDYEFTFDKFVSFENNTLVLSNASGHTWNTIVNPGLTSIVEGTYTALQPDWFNGGIIPYTSADALEYDGMNSYIYTDGYLYFSDDIVVTVDGGVYTIVMKGLAWINGGNKTYKATFTGSLGGSVEPEAPEYKTITAFDYLGRSGDLDSDPSTSGGDYVYSVKSADFDFTIGLFWNYANADGTIKDGTYNYCFNMLDYMYSDWNGFVIVDNTYHYDSTLTVSGSTITLTLYTNDELVGVYVYDGSNGGGVEPEPEPEVNAVQLTSMKSTGSGYNGYGPYYSFEMSNESNSKVAINVSPDASSLTSLNAGSYHYEGNGNIDMANYGFNGKAWIDGSYIGLMQDGSSMVVETDGVDYKITMALIIEGVTYNFVCETTFVAITTLETPNVTATVNGNSITASWNAVAGAGSYALYINGELDGDVIVTSVTYEKLEYSTDYTISVVAKPANTATHKDSAAGSVTVTTEADPNAGGGETPSEDYSNWNYGAVIDQNTGVVTLTDRSGTGRVVTFKLNEVAMTTFYADTTRSNYFTDVKVDGVAATATAESTFTFGRSGWSSFVDIDMVINGVTYTGRAAALDF